MVSLADIWNTARKDVIMPKNAPTELLVDKHVKFIHTSGRDTESYMFQMSEYIRVDGIYWCLAALDFCGRLEEQSKEDIERILNFITESRNKDGGYGSAKGHDSQLLHTLCAVQALMILKRTDLLDVDSIVNFVVKLQNPDGSFRGDILEAIDTRFTFVAFCTTYLLGRLDDINVEKAVEFILKCHNFDGGFGTRPGSESHSGQVYCCIGSLAIAGCLEKANLERTAEWLADRQCPSGGLCGTVEESEKIGVTGRPEKLPDVCYSWWVLASLAIIGKLHFIDKDILAKFILACQDDETGGIADRPGDVSDPFHTIFGLGGLSLLGYGDLAEVDPVFCMTKKSLGDLSFI